MHFINKALASIFVLLLTGACASKSSSNPVNYKTEECKTFFGVVDSVNKTEYKIPVVAGHSYMAKKLLRRILEEKMSSELAGCIKSYREVLKPTGNVAYNFSLTAFSERISINLLELESEWGEVVSKAAENAQKRVVIEKEISRCSDEALALSNLFIDNKIGRGPISEYSSYKAYQACIK